MSTDHAGASGATSEPIDPAKLAQALKTALAGMVVVLDARRIGGIDGREGDLLRR